MPTMHLNETRRVRRFGDQRWILNALIGVIGVEWDQGRLGYMAGACGHDSQGDFIGLRALIKTYDDISREFMKAGRRREMRALAELKQGHAATAREGFFTASIMYGGAQWAIEANTPLNLALNQKKNECYGEFIKLAGRRIEQVEIPFAGRSVPATLHVPPDAGARKLPCVVIVSGMDGWRDISVAMDGDKWLTRGFAVLAIDGPGQGEALCREVWFDPDTYGQLGPAAYDFAASVPEIDPHRIVVNGLSFGSYWATLMAAAEPRFAACGVAMTCFEPHGFTIFETASPTFKLRFMYMTGIDDEAALETLLARIDVSVLAPAIRCPFLVAAGEDEQLSDPRHAFAFLNRLEGPKTLILYEGEDHGMHASRAGRLGPEAYTMVADWLLDRVNGRPAQSLYIEVDATGSVHSAEWGAERQYTYGLTENLKQLVFGAGPLPSNVPSPLPTSERALKAAE